MTVTQPLRLPQTATGPVRVLVTGGAGFIGRHLVNRLVQRSCAVTVLDDLSTGVHYPADANPDVRFRRGSVLDPAELREVSGGVDLIFHLAGIVGKTLAFEHAEDAYRVAVRGTTNVLSVGHNCPVVVFSSSAVYGTASRGAVSETSTVDESTALAYDGGVRGYAVGKLHLEEIALDANRRGRPILVVRPFNVVGPGQTGKYGMVVPRFVARARANQPLIVYGNGKQTRSFGHVRTFVDSLLAMVENEATWSLERPVVNLGTGRQTSILTLARTVLSVTGSTAPIEFVPYESVFPGHHDVLERSPNTTVLEQLTGRVQWPTVRTIVRDASTAIARAAAEPIRDNTTEQRAL